MKRERSLLSDARLAKLVEVARAYYFEHQTQAEIARSYGISRSQVSRYLSDARELGIVQIRINVPGAESHTVGEALRVRYPHLRHVLVALAYAEAESARTLIGRAAANFVMSVLQPGHTLALGSGRTLRALVNAMPKTDIADVTVVQTMGSMGHEAHNIDYNEIVRKAADALGARVSYVSAPAILGVGTGTADAFVTANPTLAYALRVAATANVYVVGVGSLASDMLYTRVGLIRREELEALQGQAVGDICGRFFDLQGREQPTSFNDRVVGVQLADLKRAEWSIGIAFGTDKLAPLLGAIRGGYLNAVISDEPTIQSLLDLDDKHARETASP